MKKIILLEDKVDRDSLNQANIDFDQYTNLEAVFGKNECIEYLNDFSKLDDFEIVIIHASIQGESQENIVQKVKDYCAKFQKSLVIFSGGGDIGTLRNNTLEITAKSLYINLPTFLETYPDNSHLLMLAYGEHWYLNILLRILERLNILIEENDENFTEDYDEFEDDYDFVKVKKILSDKDYKVIFLNINIEDDEITISQIKSIRDNMAKLIRDNVNE